ncbi:MAG: CPBP family intramembrane metalloprotease [Gracilibacteraceae bacterium]|jgi:membrane protease YdiL (CAAX protease family)|nr:CPBP family intramembrane metalloprotease [Gracilibacteraceae bacterium]
MDESGTATKPGRGGAWPEPAWNFWQALFLLLLIYLFQFACGWMGRQPYPGERAGAAEFMIRGFGGALVTFVLLSIFLRLKGRQPSALGLGRLRPRYVLCGGGAGIVLFFLTGFLGALMALVFGEPAVQNFALAVEGSDAWWQVGALLLLGGVVVPLQEELLFRGLLYPPLRKLYGPGGGLTRCALFFALIHFDAPRFFPILAGGFILGLLFERYRSLWPAVIAHGVWNGLMVALVLVRREF